MDASDVKGDRGSGSVAWCRAGAGIGSETAPLQLLSYPQLAKNPGIATLKVSEPCPKNQVPPTAELQTPLPDLVDRVWGGESPETNTRGSLLASRRLGLAPAG